MRFADIVHEVSRARRDWASEFLWQRGVGGAATDGQAKAQERGERWAEGEVGRIWRKVP